MRLHSQYNKQPRRHNRTAPGVPGFSALLVTTFPDVIPDCGMATSCSVSFRESDPTERPLASTETRGPTTNLDANAHACNGSSFGPLTVYHGAGRSAADHDTCREQSVDQSICRLLTSSRLNYHQATKLDSPSKSQ
jgi:hypothetical protein